MFSFICIICSILYLLAKMWCVETLLTIDYGSCHRQINLLFNDVAALYTFT